jgi:hypothetical protein
MICHISGCGGYISFAAIVIIFITAAPIANMYHTAETHGVLAVYAAIK